MNERALTGRGISIGGRLTHFIISIHLSTVRMHEFLFFHFVLLFLAFFLLLFAYLRECMSFDASRISRSKHTHTLEKRNERQTKKKERHRSIHSFIHSSLVLFSSLTNVRMMVVIFFFSSRIEIGKERQTIGEDVFMPSAFYSSLIECTLVCIVEQFIRERTEKRNSCIIIENK